MGISRTTKIDRYLVLHRSLSNDSGSDLNRFIIYYFDNFDTSSKIKLTKK